MIRFRLPAALALAMLLLTAPLGAQDPAPAPILKLSLPQNVAVGDMATISVDPSSNVQDVQFVCVPMPANPNNWAPHGDFAELVCGADCPEGDTFTIVAAANLNGKTITATTTVTFAVPEPPPPPVPPPGPTPPPLAANLWLITVYDAANPTPAITNLVSDLPFWYGLSKEGHQYKLYDRGNAEAAPFIAAAANVQVAAPFTLFMDADSHKVLAVKPLPLDEAAITAEVDALTKPKGRST